MGKCNLDIGGNKRDRLCFHILIGIILLVIAISSLVFISGCSGTTRSGRGVEEYDFHTGTQGLELRFLTGNPPQRLYAGDPLNVLVEYTNKGAYNIVDGRIYLSGYDKEYLVFDKDAVIGLSAEGKSVFNPEGMISEIVEFHDPAVSMPPETDKFRQIIKATACYTYKTFASAQVCIDPDPLSVEPEDKVCTVHNVGLASQGAPVVVTSIEEEAVKGRVQFKISISNVGGGTVIGSDNGIIPLDRCHALLSRDEVDKVELFAYFSPERVLDCKPAVVRLTNGKGFAYCTYPAAGQHWLEQQSEAYQTNLNIELYYGYRQSVAANVDILKLPGTEQRVTPYTYGFR